MSSGLLLLLSLFFYRFLINPKIPEKDFIPPIPDKVYNIRGKLIRRRIPKSISEEDLWKREQTAPPDDPA